MALVFVTYLIYAHIGYNSDLAGSPNGQYVARIMITQGTPIDSEYSSVIVRRSWGPYWTQAFVGEGWLAGGGEASPYLHWADNSHLIIDYHSSMPKVCASHVDDIVIECHAHIW